MYILMRYILSSSDEIIEGTIAVLVKYLVPARSAGARYLTKSAPRFTAAKPP